MDLADHTLTDAQDAQLSEGLPALVVPHLIVALECARPSAGVARHSLANVDRVILSRGPTRSALRKFDGCRSLVVRVPDARMSAEHARIVRDGGSFVLDDLGSRNGTRVGGVPVTGPTVLADGDLIEAGHTLLRFREAFAASLGEPADQDSACDAAANLFPTILPALGERARALSTIARSTLSVLLLGETGTGKELLAQAIHRASGRVGNLVAVNCGALPPGLLETQLFGHLRGSFSGAVKDELGLFRTADRGTVFLDEIGDLPASSQAALLRVIQEREVVPVGGSRAIKVDYRLIAATHRSLDALVAEGHFRSDLLARVAAYTFHVPPARARADDVGLWVAAHVGERTLSLTPSAGRALLNYDWPLNIRELVHALDAATALACGAPLDVQHLPPSVTRRAAPRVASTRPSGACDQTRERLLVALSLHRGNVSAVARDLGKARMQVQRWMKQWGVDAASFRR